MDKRIERTRHVIGPAVIAALMFFAAVFSSSLQAAPVVYLDQAEFTDALVLLGYSPMHEGFEDDAVWGSVRSTISGGFFAADSITHLGIAWTANSLNGKITTGQGAAFTGEWGFYAYPHGSYSNPDPGRDCLLPGECGDGWRGMAMDQSLVAIGGWVSTNTPPAKLGLYLGNYPTNPIDFGETCVPPDSENCTNNSAVSTASQFWGVIDTDGFTQFEFRELEGKLEIDGADRKNIFADDFWFASESSDLIMRDGFESP
jgi:hypothetical protein